SYGRYGGYRGYGYGYYPWYGLGYYGGGYGPYYGYGYDYSPGYYYDNSYPDYYPAPEYYGSYSTNQGPIYGRAPTAVADDRAHINVIAPPEAEVWFEDQKMSQTGQVRSFVSPPLTPGRDFV